MIVAWLAQHWLMFLTGVTAILGLGCMLMTLAREPILRQRCGELAVLCAMLWLFAAMVPLPRLLPNLFGGGDSAVVLRGSLHREVEQVATSPEGLSQDSTDSNQDSSAVVEQSQSKPIEDRSIATADSHEKALAQSSQSQNRWKLFDANQLSALFVKIYLGVIAACVLWLVIGRVLVWRIVSCGRLLSEDSELRAAAKLENTATGEALFAFTRRLRVVQSPRCGIPFTYGLVRPTIVLPNLENEQNDRSVMIQALRHEWAHVQRGDSIGRFILNAAFPLLSLHPMYWWLRRSSIFASELLADEYAASGSSRAHYSSELVALVKQQRFMQRLVLGTSPIISSKSEFYQRIEQLLKRTQDLKTSLSRTQRWSLFGVLLMSLGIAVGVLGINGPSLFKATAADSVSRIEGIEFTDDWNINNIVSTSRDTPATAIVIPTSQTVEVRGSIRGADYTPLEGVTIWAATLYDDFPLRERVQTDSKGEYVLHLKPLTGKRARWQISAFKGNQYAKVDANLAWIQSESPKQPMPLITQLTDGASTRCRILEAETKKPVPNARLYLSDSRIFISDADGMIDIAGIEYGTHEFVVLASDFARVYTYFDNTAQSKSELNVYLPKANRIVGSITDESGRGIPHACVRAFRSGNSFAIDGDHSLADREGNFSWQGLRKDTPIYGIAAMAPGYEGQEALHLASQDDQPLKVSFKLPVKKPVESAEHSQQQVMAAYKAQDPGKKLAGAIVGRVVDENGNPVKNFQVFSGVPEKSSGMERVNHAGVGFGHPMSYTSDDGRFILGHEINSDFLYRVMVRAEGFADSIVERVVAGSVEDVTKAQEQVFEMKKPHSLDVQVSAASASGPQQSIAGANVTLIDNRPYLDYLQFDWRSDEFRYPSQCSNDQGLASFPSVAFGEATVAVRAKGYARQRFGWRNGETKFDVTLVPEASISGKIRAADGSIPKDMWFYFRNLDGVYYEIPIKDESSFHCDELLPDTYVIELHNYDKEFCRIEFTVAAGESVDFELTIEKGSKSASIREVGRTRKEVVSGAVATINGRDPSVLTFQEGLDRFKRYTKLTEAESITEEQLRRALAKAAVELKGILRNENKEAVAAALKKLAEGDDWPFGVRLYAPDRLFLDSPITYRIYIPLPGVPNPSSPTAQFTIDP